jgi:hypothetical protein
VSAYKAFIIGFLLSMVIDRRGKQFRSVEQPRAALGLGFAARQRGRRAVAASPQ